MYINKHDGKHMNGNRMKILLLNLPFLLQDLVAPEVIFYIVPDVIHDIMSDIGSDVVHHVYPMLYTISCRILVKLVSPTRTDVSIYLTDQVDQC